MSDRDRRPEEELDRILEEVRAATLDEATVAAATARVWRRLEAGEAPGHRPLGGCDDVRALIPDLLAGGLSPARALLVSDHARECPACRRALAAARRGPAPTPADGSAAARRGDGGRWLWLAAAAALVLALGLLGVRTTTGLLAEHRLQASVAAVDGTLQLVGDGSAAILGKGATLRAGERVRTAKRSGAVLRLADASTVEMAPRSELELHASARGTTIRLARGNIIVHAAEQHGERLFVATGDCRVAVKGTIFAVDHGLKGSRVSVIQGEVEVRRASGRDLLLPGQQITTSDRLVSVPIAEQIAWSRDADRHLELLRQLTSLQREVLAAVEPIRPRTSTELLDLAPPDTVLYVAVPNLADGVAEARAILARRLAENAVLAEWWQREVVDNGIDRRLDALLDRLQPLGASLGDEVVLAVPAATLSGGGGPLVMARLEDPASFRALLGTEVESFNEAAGRTVMAVVDDPAAAVEPGTEVVIWVADDVFAATTEPSLLGSLALRIGDPAAARFAGTPLHARLLELYRSGVSWLVGVDLQTVMAQAAAAEDAGDRALMERLGVLDAGTLVIERHRLDERYATSAELSFTGPRRGLAGWLAAPAPMGSLSFVSPQASLAAAVVAKDPAQMLDELLGAVGGADQGALEEIGRVQSELGFDLRADLAATLGGEATFAIDGPLLPSPAWKLVVEIYDPQTFQATVERAVARASQELEAHGRSPLTLETSTDGGRSYVTLRQPETGVQVVWVVTDGYLLAAPARAVIEQALQYRAAGVALTDSEVFRGLLPDNGYTDCSALLYRNLGDLAATLAAQSPQGLPSSVLEAVAEPSLVCAYGERDRILVSGIGAGLLRSFSGLGLAGLAPLAGPSPDPVSSPG